MPLDWKQEYSVKVEEIDNQHKILVSIIADLMTAINEKKIHSQVEDILSRLIEFAEEHFFTEEKYFKKFNYEKAKEHVTEHEKFKETIKDFNKRFEKNEIEISFELIDFLEDWLLDHLLKQDQKYVECFQEHGLI